jgi:uncharacterized protein YcfL
MTSSVFLFNPDTSGSASVTLRILDQTGAEVFNKFYTVPKDAAILVTLPNSLGSGFKGAALVSSDKNVFAIVTDANSSQSARDLYEGSVNPSSTLTLPLFRHLAADTGNSIIAVQNTSNSPANITLHWYNASGAEINSQTASSVPALASTYFDTNSLFPSSTFIGSAKITADQNVAATLQTHFIKDTASFRGLAATDDGTTLYLNLVERKVSNNGTAKSWNETYVRNNGNADTDITVQYFSSAGTPVSTKTTSGVHANGMAQFWTNDPSYSDLGNSFKGWAKITSSTQPVSAYSLEAQGKGNRLFGINAVSQTLGGVSFACGDVLRTANQNSKINILNLGGSDANVRIRVYRPSDGAVLVNTTIPVAANSVGTATLSDAAFAAAGSNYEGLAIVTSTGASPPQLVVSVNTPYLTSGKANGVTSYTCNKLQ